MSFRDIKAKARRDLHLNPKGLGVAAFYFIATKDIDTGRLVPSNFPLRYTVRVHNSWSAKGDQAGTSLHSAERVEDSPQLVFWYDHLKSPLKRGDVVIISEHEGYRIDNSKPRYNETQTADVIPMKPEDIVGFPVPGAGGLATIDITMSLPIVEATATVS